MSSQVHIYLPLAALEKMPAVFKERAFSGGAVLSLEPVLFTQVGVVPVSYVD